MNYMGCNKFKDTDKIFHENLSKILSSDVPDLDLIHQFPIYVGHVNLAKYFFFYDLYKRSYKLAGHIADVGTWKGSTFFFMSKLVRLFESYSFTQVHGFDWFKGMDPDPKYDDMSNSGLYKSDYESLLNLIKLQKLEDISIVHKLDLTKDLNSFFKEHNNLRFKMVFVDCGIAKVLEKTLEHFWPRLVYGGILMMDHYNLECSPTESDIVERFVGKNKIRHIPFNRQPTAYIIKKN